MPQEEETSENAQLVFAAIDATRRYDKLKQVKDSLPEHLRPYCDITRAYMEKHAAIDAVLARMETTKGPENL